jgi:LysM repeat protein
VSKSSFKHYRWWQFSIQGGWSAVAVVVLLLGLAFTQPLRAASLYQSEPPATHVVQRGETLSEIAQAYGVLPEELMAMNGISNPNQIYVGQELTLPPNASRIGQPNIDIPTYTVKAGETLSQIAEKYNVSPTRLMYMNGMRDPNAIYVGQVLRLPATTTAGKPATTATEITTTQPTTSPTPATTPSPSATAMPKPATHLVQAGETLSQIAEKYDVPLADLMQVNGIQNSDAIYVGQELRLPGAQPATATATATLEPTPTATETATPTAPPTTLATTASPDATTVTITATTTITAAEQPLATAHNESKIASLNATYTIRTGDTLLRIARRVGVDVEALRQLNRLPDDATLVAGGTLLLPATTNELRVTVAERSYTVQAGDSLGQIAQKFDVAPTELLAANFIANPDTIYVGQHLTIPGKQAVEATSAAPQNVGPQRSGYFYYTVQSGDTLSALASQFGSTPLAILDYNALPNAETVFRGLEIRIPYGPPALPVRLPPVPSSGNSFLVSLSRQECWLFAGTQVRYAWKCSTGYGEWVTRTGNFAVQSKIENAKSRAYQLDMPYWLGIYNVGSYENGIHGLPVKWSDGQKIWAGLIGQPATFGCAMLADEDASVLFKLAYIGMPVYIIN